MKKILTFLLLFLCASQLAEAQHRMMFSQYMFNGFVLNPAYAGNRDVLTLVTMHRNQWSGFDGSPKTTTFSAHTPLKNKKINIGMSYINDRYGITTRNKLNIAYAYRMIFPKSTLFLGIQGGVNLLRNNWNLVQTTDPGDYSFIGQDELSSIPEAGIGAYFKTDKFYAGISAPTLFTSQEAGMVYQPAFMHLGYVFFLPNNIRLKHSFLAKYIKNSPPQFDFNTNAYYKNIGIGFSYRTNDAFVFMLEYELNEQFKAGYAYDLSITRLALYNKGSHEIMLRYEFGYGVTATNPRYF